MDRMHGISAADRRLMLRLAVALLAIFVGLAAFSRLDRFYSHKFFDSTGRAEWIWPHVRLSRGTPVACFATRDFDLAPSRYFTRIKIGADPEYTLYFNGREIGGRRTGEEYALDVYDVSALARDKGNRIVVALRSANGVGGLIASVDLSPDYKNIIPTGSEWRIVRRWNDRLLLQDAPVAAVSAPMLLGRPPIGRWNYLQPRTVPLALPLRGVVEPHTSFAFETALPDIDIVSGVAVAVSRPTRATAYDFGPVRGRARVTVAWDEAESRAVRVRFANARAELMSIEGPVDTFVFAPGEKTVVDSQLRSFRYVMVYGAHAAVDVLQ
ncbi:MAG TPA: hypothetical protein VKH35_05285 [Thermoanaerobaculia bacterium]|nr:hypothetical protein [Thermoanaerobaculia bacterium]